MMILNDTLSKVNKNDFVVEVFGLGYVGFPLCVKLSKSGLKVLGVDKDSKKIDRLQNNMLSPSEKIFEQPFLESKKNGNLSVSQTTTITEKPKIGIIAVPTPVPELNKDSNLYVKSAVRDFLSEAKKGDVLILESSVQVGTTDEISEIVSQQGFKIGDDFGLCFCPERIDPLNAKWNLENIPRVIYCSDDTTFGIVQKIYQHVNNSNLFRVSSAKIAEVVKSYENTFRLINIGLVNELAILCSTIGINVKEVIDAAATKPFGFMPFYPGAGAGGHCIPKDPLFLLLSAKKQGLEFNTIENAIKVNSIVPIFIAREIDNILTTNNLPKSVLISGLSYKPNIEDMRDSPSFKLAFELSKLGIKVGGYDPFYKEKLVDRYLIENKLEKIPFENLTDLTDETIGGYSCLCVVQNHSKTSFRINEIYNKSLVPVIFDCQNNLKINPESKSLLRGFGN